MTNTGMTDYLCLLPFNFNDPTYVELDTMVLDFGMGLDPDWLFESAISIMFEITTVDDVMSYLDEHVFPEHVPNDSLSSCLTLCVIYINYVTSKLVGFKSFLNLMIRHLDGVILDRYASTVHVKFEVS